MKYNGMEIPPLRLVQNISFAKVGSQSYAVLDYGGQYPPVLVPAEQAQGLFDSMGYYYSSPNGKTV